MAKPSSRGPVPGPTIIRQLAQLAASPPPASSPSVPDRLSQWFDWNRAVALQGALDGRLPPAEADAACFDASEEADCARIRTEMGTLVARTAMALGDADHEACRTHYLSVQRSLQAATGRLRGRLRDMLAQGTPTQARLAQVDALLEQVLSPRESSLLAGIPLAIRQRAERHATAESPHGDIADGAAATAAGPAPGQHHTAFVRELQALLQSELELRFLPIDGLLSALRTH